MAPIGRSTRTSLAVVAAAALTLTGTLTAVAAGPGAPLDANALEPGAYTTVVDTGTDFTIHATEAKDVDVDGTDRVSDRGDRFSQRIKLNGTGTAEARSLHFTVEADEVPTQVVVSTRSGSGSADRALALYDAAGEVARVVAPADDAATPVATAAMDVTAPGDYYLASPSSGVNVYAAQLGPVDLGERAAWSEAAAPTVDAVRADPERPGTLLVDFTGLLGADGGDVARVTLYDAAGMVVDQALTVGDGPGGTVALTPSASGDHEVEVAVTRYGETDAHVSARVAHDGFVLPLAAPEITSALTTAVAGGAATVTVEWGEVAEAASYAVQVADDDGWATAVDGVAGTSAEVTGLVPGATYRLRVVAQRGDDAAAGPETDVAVATAVERWKTADVGSNAGSGGSVTENADGTITFDARESATKLATSEDGFQYFYTEIDPETENFTLTATFRVDDASAKDNQSGFGVIAVDTLVPDDTAARYFNSAGALATRFGEGSGTTHDGMPGGRFVTGYTGPPTDNGGGARDQSDSAEFDPGWRPDVSGPKFATGDVLTLSLRRSNTGYHAVWHRDGEELEVIDYDPGLLQRQDPDRLYVGMAVARKILVTVTDWDFTTVRPEDDEAAQEPPTEYVPATLDVDVTTTTPSHSLDVPLVSNMHGTGQILDADGGVVVDGVELAPGERALATVGLEEGENDFTVRLLPDAEQPQLGEREELESTDPVDVPLTVTVDSYGLPGQSIRVAPDGTPDGDGTAASPLDLHTAVAYAQAGQQIVLAPGTYTPPRKVVVERGRDGTSDAPITLMSEPGSRAVLDLSQSPDGGLVLRGDWWHVYDLEITGSRDKAKPMLIEGHHNVVERVESHHNADTGLQISGRSAEPSSMWPSHNVVVSSVAHHNADAGGNDADGFAAKLTVGEGNVFRHDIAYNNIDDGWDLFAKSISGPIGTVVIEDSVAYDNGWLSDDPSRTGEGNGFKLGGESMPGDHLLRNAVSYGNLGTGVTSNSGPDVRVDRVTSVGNDRGVRLETNAAATAYEARGVISWRNTGLDTVVLRQDDTSLLTDPSNHWSLGGASAVDEGWFVSTDFDGVRPEIAADGSIDLHGLLELTDAAPADAGARFAAVEDPTVIEVLPEVTVPLENTVAPSILGDAVKGAVLTAVPGDWTRDDVRITYRWLRDGEPVRGRGDQVTYRVKQPDVGHELSVEVTATVAGQDPVVATSDPVTVEGRDGEGHGGGHGGLVDAVRDLLDWLRRIFAA